jgi:hypothetical protein
VRRFDEDYVSTEVAEDLSANQRALVREIENSIRTEHGFASSALRL